MTPDFWMLLRFGVACWGAGVFLVGGAIGTILNHQGRPAAGILVGLMGATVGALMAAWGMAGVHF